MEFDNSFEVPLPPAQAWAVLMDIERIAPCMPGAALTEVVDPQTYKGKISVRLGPVALAFAGLVKFEDVDDANYSARVKAQGTDAKGRGGANAAATFRLEPAGTGSKVLVHTDLTLSGAVAQYGRGVGMIQSTAAQIIGQFAKNLRAQLTEPQPATLASAPPLAPSTPTPPVPMSAAPRPPSPMAPAPMSPTKQSAPMPSPPMPPAPPGAAPPAFITRAAGRSPIEPPLPPARPLPPRAAKPISGLTLIARVMWDRFVTFLTGSSQR